MSKLIKLGLFIAVGYGAYILFFQAEWYTVGSTEEGFTVEFPQVPKKETQRRNLPVFGLSSITTYSQQTDYSIFITMVMASQKIKRGVISEELVEQGTLDRVTKTIKGRLISVEPGVHRGVPYSEMEFRIDASSSTMFIRSFHTDGRVFVFLVASPTMIRTTSGQDRFFRSVRFPDT